MKHEIEIPFPVGATVWWVGPEWTEVQEPCSDCAGTRQVTMVMGNGVQHILACAGCSRGYDAPTGSQPRTICGYKPQEMVLNKLDLSYGDSIRYVCTGVGLLNGEDLFATKEDCAKACKAKRALQQAVKDEQFYARRSKGRDMAWSVHYWRRERGRLRKDLKMVEARIKEIQA